MIDKEYEALVNQYRRRWAAEDRIRHAGAMARLRRLIIFVAAMTILAAGIGAVMH